jgi:hypothetical protein
VRGLSMAYTEESKMAKIVLHFSQLYGGGSLEIYNDSYNRLTSLFDNLQKARKISTLFLSKEALSEGVYNIEIYENNILLRQYIVLNSENVYDMTNNQYLRSDALSDVYRIFVHFLLRDRINTE